MPDRDFGVVENKYCDVSCVSCAWFTSKKDIPGFGVPKACREVEVFTQKLWERPDRPKAFYKKMLMFFAAKTA
jgi:hypothetical protein